MKLTIFFFKVCYGLSTNDIIDINAIKLNCSAPISRLLDEGHKTYVIIN